jgi:hypothetical protein
MIFENNFLLNLCQFISKPKYKNLNFIREVLEKKFKKLLRKNSLKAFNAKHNNLNKFYDKVYSFINSNLLSLIIFSYPLTFHI